MKQKEFIKKFFVYFFLIIGSLIMIFPFYWMLSSAAKTPAEYASFPPKWWPNNWLNFSNYIEAFKTADFVTYFKNSFFVVIVSVTINTITTILAAFAFSRLRFTGRKMAFTALLSFMMVPFEMLVITNYQTVAKLGLVNTIWVLIIPFTTSIFYTYILKNFFDTIPDSLYYSAKIDGASNWKYLWRVMIPIAKPSLFTIILLNVIASWNSYLWTQLTIFSDKYRTVPLGLAAFMTDAGSNPQLQLSAAAVTVLPMIVLFLFFRKYIVSGVSSGGIKG
ncbi:MAG: carbohydrate ABC transporter permease [Erysipelotrichaceae bacterium]|nr:carbohydrate ABC transporter permease [Erysipelotrichaceae bacterium]